jgi:hypothetical protein
MRRFALRSLLLAVGLIGTLTGITGIWIRNYYNQIEFYEQVSRNMNHCSVLSMWRVTRGGDARLAYLIVTMNFGDGSYASGGDGRVRSPANPRGFEGIGMWSSGIYVDGEKLDRSDEGYCWVARANSKTVEEIPLPFHYRTSLTPAVVRDFEHSEIWNDFVAPIVETERKQYWDKIKSGSGG